MSYETFCVCLSIDFIIVPYPLEGYENKAQVYINTLGSFSISIRCGLLHASVYYPDKYNVSFQYFNTFQNENLTIFSIFSWGWGRQDT